MKTSDTLTKIAPALLAAQKAITFAAKDSNNPHFKSKYADLPGVIEAIKEPLNSVGIVFLQTQGKADQGTMTLTTRLLHESGEWIEDTATIPLPKSDPQGFGSANTYGRRYGLASIIGLYQDDDDGNAASGVGQKAATQAPQPQPAPLLDLTDVYLAMREADTLDSLKTIFGNAYKQSNDKQRPELTAKYNEHKSKLEKVTA